MTAPRRDRRAGEPRRPRADHGHAPSSLRRPVDELELPPRSWIHETGGELVLEDEVEAGLVACDADVDARAVTVACLVGEFRICKQRARHRNHVGIAARQNLLGGFRRVDAVRRNHGNAYRFLQAACGPGKRAARHCLRDGWNARLVPADAGVEQRSSSGFDGLRNRNGFLGAQSLLDEVQRAKPASAKGRYMKRVNVSSTMGPGVKIDPNRLRPEVVERLGAS